MGRVIFSKACVEQGSTWGTEVACGATDQLLADSIDIQRANAEFLPDPSLQGTAWGNPGKLGAKGFEGTVLMRARYGANVPRLMALAFGTSGAPSGGPTYSHTLTLADRLTKFITLAWTVVGNATKTAYYSVPSAMIEDLTMRWTGASWGDVSLGVVGCQMARDAGTNGSTQFSALTVPDSSAPILATDGRFRLNAASGSTLGSGDILKPVGVEFRLRRPLARDFKMDSAIPGQMSQPIETDSAEVTLSLDFAGKGSASSYATDIDEFEDRFEAGTELKADLLLTGPSPNTILLQFPRLQVVEQPSVNVPATGRYPHRVVLRGMVAASAPTGMAGITQPVQGTVTDGLSGAYVA